jgi:uncharacterized protein with NAD-binding domain and iron-sulfur cluster
MVRLRKTKDDAGEKALAAAPRPVVVAPDEIETPGSLGKPTVVAVFGAGIAGLTAAHELAQRGFIVFLYEQARDPMRTAEDRAGRPAPPVRLGGMAATQYLHGDRLRLFPKTTDTSGSPEPTNAPTGEHGFRFFPAFYLHLWDMLQRIPVYDDPLCKDAKLTARTVYDNVQRVITQAVTANGRPSLILPREAPRSASEFFGSLTAIKEMGFTASDVSTFLGRLTRYLATSPQRRSAELEDVAAYDFIVGRDPETGSERFQYSGAFRRYIFSMPKILAAFDARYGDARTNLTTFIQLNLALDRYDSKADGVLNGPTTEAWFDHWYRHLVVLDVTVRQGALAQLFLDGGELKAEIDHDAGPNGDPARLAEEIDAARKWAKAKGIAVDEHGDPLSFDYVVVATDSYTAETATSGLRVGAPPELRSTDPGYAREASTVLGLDGWATSRPPDKWPTQPKRPLARRDPTKFDEMGWKEWDRFQTLSGVQFFFDTEFQIVRGHIYFSDSEWSLSAINQSGFWLDAPNLNDDCFVSVMSVDICDWNTKSSHLGRPARECTRDEIAREVWRQITAELAHSSGPGEAARQVPLPIWYAVDEFIEFGVEEGKPEEHPVRNRAPYLIPIMGDWKNRPGGYPWNPHGGSATIVPNARMKADQKALRVWQAGHGGYQVHYDKLVFAGTWCKTFTRMTSMEAACESGRHAVNAILDHYLYEQSGRKDQRDKPALSWRLPFGFVDQELSSPIRQPTPAGDYCFIFDCENREPADARATRDLDAEYYARKLPHPWQLWGIDNAVALASRLDTSGGSYSYDPGLLLVEQLREWRYGLENLYGRPGDRDKGSGYGKSGPSGPWESGPLEPDEPFEHEDAEPPAEAAPAGVEDRVERRDGDDDADDEDDDDDGGDGIPIEGRELLLLPPDIGGGTFRPAERLDPFVRIRRAPIGMARRGRIGPNR